MFDVLQNCSIYQASVWLVISKRLAHSFPLFEGPYLGLYDELTGWHQISPDSLRQSDFGRGKCVYTDIYSIYKYIYMNDRG